MASIWNRMPRRRELSRTRKPEQTTIDCQVDALLAVELAAKVVFGNIGVPVGERMDSLLKVHI